MALINCPECKREVSDTAPACPGCGYVLQAKAVSVAPAKGPLSTERQILVEQRVTNEGPSTGVAYLLWFFLGLLGAHRFYLNRIGSAVAMLVLTLTFFGIIVTAIWALVDAFLIPEMIRENRNALRNRLLQMASI